MIMHTPHNIREGLLRKNCSSTVLCPNHLPKICTTYTTFLPTSKFKIRKSVENKNTIYPLYDYNLLLAFWKKWTPFIDQYTPLAVIICLLLWRLSK